MKMQLDFFLNVNCAITITNIAGISGGLCHIIFLRGTLTDKFTPPPPPPLSCRKTGKRFQLERFDPDCVIRTGWKEKFARGCHRWILFDIFDLMEMHVKLTLTLNFKIKIFFFFFVVLVTKKWLYLSLCKTFQGIVLLKNGKKIS